MELAFYPHAGRPLAADSSTPHPRYKRALLTGVALAGASVIAVTPVAPTAPALAAAVTDRDVQLAAWTDPLTTWQNALQTAFGHVEYGLNEIATMYPVYMQDILGGTPTLIQELGGVLINVDGWQQFVADLPSYGERISTALQKSAEDSQGQFDGLGEMVEMFVGFLQAKEFNRAYATVNEYFLWTLGAGAWPLFDLLYMPGEIAETLGAEKLANVLDVLLTDNALGNVTEAILGPVVTAAFQFTEALDDLVAAIDAQDWESAASEMLNMPAKVANAYLNGFIPRLAIEDEKPWPWQGVLTAKGTFEHFLFTLPRDLAWAMKSTRAEFLAAVEAKHNSQAALPETSSTELASEDALLTVDVTPAVPGAREGADATVRSLRTTLSLATEETVTEDTAAEETVDVQPAVEKAAVVVIKPAAPAAESVDDADKAAPPAAGTTAPSKSKLSFRSGKQKTPANPGESGESGKSGTGSTRTSGRSVQRDTSAKKNDAGPSRSDTSSSASSSSISSGSKSRSSSDE